MNEPDNIDNKITHSSPYLLLKLVKLRMIKIIQAIITILQLLTYPLRF